MRTWYGRVRGPETTFAWGLTAAQRDSIDKPIPLEEYPWKPCKPFL